MTIKELNRTNHLIHRIRETERRIQELQDRASSVNAGRLGVPRGTGIADKVGEGAAAIVDEKKRLRAQKRRCAREYKKLCAYISSVNDIHVQRIMELKFIDGYSWTKVAMTIGGKNTADSVRMACTRYLEKYDKTR